MGCSGELPCYELRTVNGPRLPPETGPSDPCCNPCNDKVITRCYPESEWGAAMPASQQPREKRDTLNLRIKPDLRALIDRAADASGRNRTDFVLSAARRAAEETLLDRTHFAVDSKTYAEFLARLDAPPRPNKRLRRSLETIPPWEK